MILRHAAITFAAAILAVAAVLGVWMAQPQRAEAADTVTVTGCTGTDVVLDASEKQVLDLHNKTRTSKGLPKFCVHPALQAAAEKHSRDMMDRDYFSHNTKGTGVTFAQRIEREGYNYSTAGENIAWGSGSLGSPDSIFKSWMKSDGHRKNILRKSFREIGIGAAGPGTFKGYWGAVVWTADFGAR